MAEYKFIVDNTVVLNSYKDFLFFKNHYNLIEFGNKSITVSREILDAHRKILDSSNQPTFQGVCSLCCEGSKFTLRFPEVEFDSTRQPNWREELICTQCHHNNRVRGALSFVLANSRYDDYIYLTECYQPKDYFIWKKYKNIIQSEYLRDGTPLGSVNNQGIRNEDITHLTFHDNSIDTIGSFDVLEHVPNYTEAIAEFYRVLKPGGKFVITVPFYFFNRQTEQLAWMEGDTIVWQDFDSQEYHGTPDMEITDDPKKIHHSRAPCFYHYSWDLLDSFRSAGFTDVGIAVYYSEKYAHIGWYQHFIVGIKPV